MGLSLPLWPTIFYLPLALCFYYFLLAGARTFEIRPEDDSSSGIAQFSFFVTGLLGTIALGYRSQVSTLNAIAGGALMACALALYEWARHTIAGRRFHIAWSGAVPGEVCEAGPYRYVRHPSYTGALLTFYGLAIGFEHLWAAIVIVVPTTVAFLIRMRVEEAVLRAAFPREYPAYERSTARLVPFVY
jgi:protein-S-isoprenylcysteine O-methyltransferase Ste14